MIGADAMSRYVDWTDRGSCILFGDAAGAVLIQVRSSVLFFSTCDTYYLVIPFASAFWESFLYHW